MTCIKKKYNQTISKSSLYNVIKRLNITHKKIRKKKIYGDINRLKSERKKLQDRISKLDVNKIISIDESSYDTTLYPLYEWTLKG